MKEREGIWGIGWVGMGVESGGRRVGGDYLVWVEALFSNF